jgi:hypothetical protein
MPGIIGAHTTDAGQTMGNTWILRIATFSFVVFIVWLLAWLTMPPQEDPCAGAQTDISAAVIADQPGDQDALVNRAIIMRGKCEPKAVEEEEK